MKSLRPMLASVSDMGLLSFLFFCCFRYLFAFIFSLVKAFESKSLKGMTYLLTDRYVFDYNVDDLAINITQIKLFYIEKLLIKLNSAVLFFVTK